MLVWLCAIAAGALSWFAPDWLVAGEPADKTFLKVTASGVGTLGTLMILLIFERDVERVIRALLGRRNSDGKSDAADTSAGKQNRR